MCECLCVFARSRGNRIKKKKESTKHCWLLITKKSHAFFHVVMIQVVIRQTAVSKGDRSRRAWVRTRGRRRGEDRGVGEGEGEVEQSK